MSSVVLNESPERLLEQGGADRLASQLLMSCGLCRYLLVGEVDPRLVKELRAHCVDVDVESTLTDEPSAGHDVVVLVNVLHERGALRALATLALRRARRMVAVCAYGETGHRPAREELEQAFIESGGRKHAAGFHLSPYASLDAPSPVMWWLFEPSPKELLEAYPLAALKEERDHHMDMTREAGRRSDAHLVRYFHASEFVRPGDRVLDAACGLGYGAYTIAWMSRASGVSGLDLSKYATDYANCAFSGSAPVSLKYHVGDAEDLSAFPDESVDFFVSVETLEHVPSPRKLLAEVYRVLSPGGRMYVSVPNDWADETGEDPNPFHLHVYVWDRLAQELNDSGFLIERAWLQTAGGGMKLTHSHRSIEEFDPELGTTRDGEWILALAIKPPIHAKQSDERSRVAADLPNIVAFDRDYACPALVRAMVSIGLRATSSDLLEKFAEDAILQSAERSPDRGAALCVLLYRRLQSATSQLDWDAGVVQAAWDYVAREHESPTGLRWRVSLAYVLGLISLSQGDRRLARKAFELAAGFDALEFSPLLGTKTVGAAVLLGRLACSDGDLTLATSWWRRAIDEVRRILGSLDWSEVISDESNPETFGCPELALVVIEAGRAASGLRCLSEGPRLGRQGLWSMTNAGLDDQLLAMRIEARHFEEQVAGLEMLRAGERESLKHAMEGLIEGKSWLEGQLVGWQAEAKRLQDALDEAGSARAAERASTDEAIAGLLDSKSWLEGQLVGWQAEAKRLQDALDEADSAREAERASTDEAIAELLDSKSWLEGQLAGWQAEAKRLQNALDEADSARAAERASTDEAIAGLVEGKEWLEGQLKAWQTEAERLRKAWEEATASAAVERQTAARELAGASHEASQARLKYRTLISSWWVRLGIHLRFLKLGD